MVIASSVSPHSEHRCPVDGEDFARRRSAPGAGVGQHVRPCRIAAVGLFGRAFTLCAERCGPGQRSLSTRAILQARHRREIIVVGAHKFRRFGSAFGGF
jgi:hypothetical protein